MARPLPVSRLIAALPTHQRTDLTRQKGLIMRKLISTLALALGFAIPATTADARVSWGEGLRHVAETNVPDSQGNPMSLCHLVNYADLLFVPVYTSVQGYALSSNGCASGAFRSVSAELFADMQARGIIPATLPATPSLDLKNLIWGHAWVILVGLGLLKTALVARSSGRGRKPKKAGAPDMLAIHSLVAMSQVALADGLIDDAEVHKISSILTRLTGKAYSMQQVSDLLAQLNPSPSDIEQIGQDLSERDRQIVLEAALNIAVADGDMHPNEYAVISDLAQRMRIGANEFRGAMARITAHLQTIQPA